MSATLAPEGVVDLPLEPAANGAGMIGQLLRTLVMPATVPSADEIVSDAERIDLIRLLERVKAAAAGAQAAEMVRFASSQVESQRVADVHPRAVGRGIADQIALACKISPTAGSQRLPPWVRTTPSSCRSTVPCPQL